MLREEYPRIICRGKCIIVYRGCHPRITPDLQLARMLAERYRRETGQPLPRLYMVGIDVVGGKAVYEDEYTGRLVALPLLLCRRPATVLEYILLQATGEVQPYIIQWPLSAAPTGSSYAFAVAEASLATIEVGRVDDTAELKLTLAPPGATIKLMARLPTEDVKESITAGDRGVYELAAAALTALELYNVAEMVYTAAREFPQKLHRLASAVHTS